MLNHTVLMGRLTKDVELRYSQGGDMAIARFVLAVDRDYKAQGADKPETDFISCLAFGKTAEFISKYFGKGKMLAAVGSIQTGSYTNREGQKVYTTEVKVDKVSFTGESKQDSAQQSKKDSKPIEADDGFYPIDDIEDEDMPF